MLEKGKRMTCTTSDSLEVNLIFENWISTSKPLDSLIESPSENGNKKVKRRKTKNDMSESAPVIDNPPLAAKSPKAQILLTNIINNYPPPAMVGLPPPNIVTVASMFENMLSVQEDSPKVVVIEEKHPPPPVHPVHTPHHRITHSSHQHHRYQPNVTHDPHHYSNVETIMHHNHDISHNIDFCGHH